MKDTKEVAIFGGGCFWCTEVVFKMLKGISSVLPGYSGKPPAEVIQVEYNPAQISYHDLLTVFFGSHDPTTKNRQGNDIGPQYRSVIFYTSPEQKTEAEKFIRELSAVTELEPFDKFYEAEDYHKNFYARNRGYSYCEVIINPKLEKVQKEFAELLNDKNKIK